MSLKRLAIIPARSGSKGLKDKNIIDLCGKPLMAYSIEAATQSGLFDKVIVSTDSEEYARIAKEYGADVIIRGEELSNDKATTYVVVEDVLKRLDEEYDYFVLLQPTSPLRNAQHVKEAMTLFESRYDSFDFLISMKVADHPRVLCHRVDDDMSLKYFDTDYSNYRRQDFQDYSPNGGIFLGKSNAYLTQKHFYGPRSLAYMMDDLHSVDIDNQIDLELAKLLITRS